MAKNWYMAAKASKDPTVKELLVEFDNADSADPRKLEIKGILQDMLKGDEPDNDQNPQNETPDNDDPENPDADEPDGDQNPPPTPPTNPKGKKNAKGKDNAQSEVADFKHTEKSVKGAKGEKELRQIVDDSREEAKRRERMKPAYMSFQERIAFNKTIWGIRRVGNQARARITDLRGKEKRAIKKATVNRVVGKRAQFVRLYQRGISFTNMLTHPDGFKRDEIKEIVNADVMAACTKINPKFPSMWNAWVVKKLDKKTKE